MYNHMDDLPSLQGEPPPILPACAPDLRPDRWSYTDLAIQPPWEDELDTLDFYHATSGGEAAVARMRRDDAARPRAAVAG
jgi:hypothetical protein